MSTFDLLRKFGHLIAEHPLPVTQAMLGGFAAQFLAAHTLGGHYDRLVARAQRWLRGGEPVAGFGTFHGRVVGRVDPAVAGRPHGFSVVRRVRTQRRIGSDVWRDVHVSWEAVPFRLELASGHELVVMPGEPQLSGFEETTARAERVREVRSVVYPEERVWVTGYLEPAPKGLGAYRGGGDARKLRPPKGGQVWITRQAPADGWRKLARAHRTGGWAALASLAAGVGIAYKDLLGPWLSSPRHEMPPLPAFVLMAWLVFAVLSVAAWRGGVKAAKNAWAKRFPWL